jgi:geranylgeranyl pyrophosphate synthase
MNLFPIYAPVRDLLELTETELSTLTGDFPEPEVRDVLGQFLAHPGKRIRPALLFLAAGAGNPLRTKTLQASLVNAATAFELVHSASLVHDDVIDAADSRRGVTTISGRFGNTVAVLAGDILYAQSFLMLSDDVPTFRIILDVTKQMCLGEIYQMRLEAMTEDLYFKIIDSKTARLMSACCEVGAIRSGSSPERISILREFGRWFGFLYQLVDDWQDGDVPMDNFPFIDQIERHRILARNCLKKLPDSDCRTSLLEFVEQLASAQR